MLETLLESRMKRERSIRGAIVSVAAHTALIATAVYATAIARVPPSKPPDVLHTVYFPPRPTVAPLAAASTRATKRVDARRLAFAPPDLSVVLQPPSIDMTDVVSRPDDFIPGGIRGSRSDGNPTSGASSDGGLFRSDQVEKQVSLVPGSAAPRYPEVLRSSGIEGKVIALFVVNEDGSVDGGSIRFLHSDNRLFEDAARMALRRMRFVAAEVGGRKVRQLVQMPFVFTLSR